jgi:S-DNA-T family DNA segregation ATPase FtsK/SpoIIIE
MGAETLLGHGDMLFLPPGKGFPERVHGAFVADHEVQQVVEFLKQSGRPNYDDQVLGSQPVNRTVNIDEDGAASSEGENDPLFQQAQEIVADSRRIRTTDLQRKFRINHNRATRILEAMERNGMLGPIKNGTREVLQPSKKKA